MFVSEYALELHTAYKARQRRYSIAAKAQQSEIRLLEENRIPEKKRNQLAIQESYRQIARASEAEKAFAKGVSEALAGPIEIGKIIFAVNSEINERRIIDLVAEKYGVTSEDIISHRRAVLIVWPRQIAIYLAHIMTIHSLQSIGRRFDRDHTTVLHAIRRVGGRIKGSQKLAMEINALCVEIETAAYERAARALLVAVEQVRVAVNECGLLCAEP